jgi:hypothetical protein
VTWKGGWLPYESTDGKSLFFMRNSGDAPLLAVPVAGGPERKIVDCVNGGFGYAVGPAGIYHASCKEGGAPLYLLDLATGRDRLFATLEGFYTGITVSPDGKRSLYGKFVGGGTDLMMIENFR